MPRPPQGPPSTSAGDRRPFAPGTRSLTVGILLAVTLVSFESLAVVTVAPLFAADLGGMPLFGWVFSGFLLASLLGAVIGGQLADSGSLARPLLLGLVLFGAGLAVSGSATSMPLLIAGRVLQGLGGGALSTLMYTAITRSYPDGVRARMMALTSGAGIVPALLGPTLAAFVAETANWRYVFWGILPLLVVVGALTARRFMALSLESVAIFGGERLRAALVLVVGAGLLLVGVGLETVWLAALLAVPGAALAALGLRTLLPYGTLRLGRGLPSVVAGRGLLFAAFVGVEAFLALMLTSVHGFSTVLTGAVIASGAISWAVGAWLQARLDRRRAHQRALRLFVGVCVLTLGLATQVAAVFVTTLPLMIVVSGWVLAGLGIGVAHATSSVLAFALEQEGEEGRVAAALQIADQFMAAVSTGVGGALLALAARQGWDERYGILAALCFVVALAVFAVVAAWRSRARGARRAV